MAIKISGTTVIDNSQNITNAGTVTATSFTGDGSQLTNLPGGGGNTLEATASGTLADGSKVVVNSDGTVSVVAQTETLGPGVGDTELLTSGGNRVAFMSSAYDSTNNRVVITYQDYGNSDKGTVVVGQISGTGITFGTAVIFDSSAVYNTVVTFDSTNNKVIISYTKSSLGYAIVGEVSGTSINFPSPPSSAFDGDGGGMDSNSIVYDSTHNRVVIAYRDAGNSSYGTAIVGTVSGTSITFGTPVPFANAATYHTAATFDSTNGKVVIAYADSGNSNYGTAIVGEVADTGNTISFNGSEAVFASTATNSRRSIVYDSTNNRIVAVYQDGWASDHGKAVVGTINGDNITFSNSPTTFASNGKTDHISATFDSTNGKVVIAYQDQGNSSYGTVIAGEVNPNTNAITFGSPAVFESADTQRITATYNSTDDKVVIAYMDVGNSYNGTATVFANSGFPVPQVGTPTAFTTSTSGAYFTSAVYDSSNNKVVAAYWDLSGQPGEAVVGTVSGTSISFGTPVTFNSDYSRDMQLAYDSTNNKVIIAFKTSNSYYGAAVVGEVSGTSITFGTPNTFYSGNTNKPIPVYDSANDKVVIVYQDVGNSNSYYGKAIVGEISGTSISFPSSPVTFNSAATYQLVATYDSTNGKVIAAYQDNGNSAYGTAIVLEVSGTSINYGSSTVFVSGNTDVPNELVHDPVNNKVVITYRDAGIAGSGDRYGKAIVGTVSGTSISFNGTVTTFNPTLSGYFKPVYDSTSGKIVIFYNDVPTTSAKAIVGTISGDNISFGSPFEVESDTGDYPSLVYDSSNDKVVAVYSDVGNFRRATATVFTPFTISRNLTEENFIGISDGSYSDGQTATIQLTGAVDDAQSSLTPGQSYYVQNDGTLSETADSPSVFAGTALASTKLIVRG